MQPVDTPKEIQIRTSAEGRIESQILGYQTVDLLDLIQFLVNIMTPNACRTRGGWNDTGEHGDGLGLASPVRAQQSKHFAFLDRKADAFDGFEVTIFLDKIFHFQYCWHKYDLLPVFYFLELSCSKNSPLRC